MFFLDKVCAESAKQFGCVFFILHANIGKKNDTINKGSAWMIWRS